MYDKNVPYAQYPYSTSNYLQEFKNVISDILKPNTEYFVRLSSTSGKNEKSVKPFTTTEDIISHIASVKLFVDQEYRRDKISSLIIMPWNDQIDDRYEFRIFVVDGILTAASQQNARELYNYSAEELESIEYALNHISFLNDAVCKTYVADVYIDVDDRTCHLIEINSFGVHSGAGAALFHWITDYDILHGLNDGPPELRYLSIINF